MNKCKVLRTRKLTEAFPVSSIYSVTVVRGRAGKSLAIAFRSIVGYNDFTKYSPGYGNSGTVLYVSLSQFTYNFPSGVAIPEEFYSSIRIKEVEEEESHFRFLKATITKHIPWYSY